MATRVASVRQGYKQGNKTVSSTALSLGDLGFSASEIASAQVILLSIHNDTDIVVDLIDGSNAAANSGLLLIGKGSYEMPIGDAADFSVIRGGDTDAICTIILGEYW